MKDAPVDILAIVPADYPLILSQSFGSCCGLTALLMCLSEVPPEEATRIKETMLKAWKNMWVDNFQRSITAYIADMSEDDESDERMPQPEEYQLGFNLAIANAEKSARESLGMEAAK